MRGVTSDSYSKQGVAATDVYNDANSNFKDLRRQSMNALENDAQREMFAATYDSISNSHLNKVKAFEDKSIRTAEIDSLNAENANELQDGIVNRNDPRLVSVGAAAIVANTKAANAEFDPKVREQRVKEAEHHYYATVLNSIVEDSPKAAQGFLKENWTKLNPAVRDKMKNDIDDMARADDARSIADELSVLPLDKQLAAADKIKDTETSKMVNKLVKDNYNERQDLKKLKAKQAVNIEADKIYADPYAYKVNPNLWDTKDQDYLYNLQQRLKRDATAAKGVGSATKTDFKTWSELYNMSASDFAQVDLTGYVDRLSTADLKTFSKMQSKQSDFKASKSRVSFVSQFVNSEAEDEPERQMFLSEMFEIGRASSRERV